MLVSALAITRQSLISGAASFGECTYKAPSFSAPLASVSMSKEPSLVKQVYSVYMRAFFGNAAPGNRQAEHLSWPRRYLTLDLETGHCSLRMLEKHNSEADLLHYIINDAIYVIAGGSRREHKLCAIMLSTSLNIKLFTDCCLSRQRTG